MIPRKRSFMVSVESSKMAEACTIEIWNKKKFLSKLEIKPGFQNKINTAKKTETEVLKQLKKSKQHKTRVSTKTDSCSADPPLTPLKIIGKKNTKPCTNQVHKYHVTWSSKMPGDCCKDLTPIFFHYKYRFHSQINKHKISWNIKNVWHICSH